MLSTEESLDILKENPHKVNIIGIFLKALTELMEEAEYEVQEVDYKKEVIKNSKDIIKPKEGHKKTTAFVC